MANPEDPINEVKNIFVHEQCLESSYCQEILANFAGQATIIPSRKTLNLDIGDYPKSLAKGKKILVLAENRGHFFKPCPATKEYQCCDYQVLNIGMGCPMDCVYCILQAYLNNPWLTVFTNLDKLFLELDLALTKTKQFWRIGTGEFTDSLALDHLTGLSRYLVNYMQDKKQGVLELKTKSNSIKNLEDLDHNGRTIVSWSLNATAIMAKEELKTANLDQRLKAAKQVADWGYKLSFHFDPIVYHQDWQIGYTETIQKLFTKIPAEKITWISLGALRFLPSLKQIANTRFPGSTFFNEEFITGLDNKRRYFRTQRVEMYNHILTEIRKYAAPHTCLYFCMESEEIWQECGFDKIDAHNLPNNLNQTFAAYN